MDEIIDDFPNTLVQHDSLTLFELFDIENLLKTNDILREKFKNAFSHLVIGLQQSFVAGRYLGVFLKERCVRVKALFHTNQFPFDAN